MAVDADINFDQAQITRESETRPRPASTPNLPSLPGILTSDESGAPLAERSPLPLTTTNGGNRNRIVEQVVSAPGSIRRLSVGIALDKALTADETRQLSDLLSASIGLDASRGDVISIVARPALASAGVDAGKTAVAFPLAHAGGEAATTETGSIRTATASTAPALRNSDSGGDSRAGGIHPLIAAGLFGALVLIAAFLLLRRGPARPVQRRMSEDERQQFVLRLKKLIDTGDAHGKA